ncbi:MAG: membrane protein [Cyanobium sp. CACIAM 14]|nr:MAG: membrane protein [Cyanobium sp. CACIAM 14]
MELLTRQPRLAATALLVPLLALASPGWLTLDGVAPCWAVLWLLPWALSDGPVSGAFTGLGLGLLLDGLHAGAVTQVPALMLLGWWWGRMGRRAPPIQRSFSLGLLALLGSALLGISLMLQWALLDWFGVREAAQLAGPVAGSTLERHGVNPALLALPGWRWDDLAGAGVQVLLAQTLITALLAPMLCSLQLLLWRQLGSGWRR